MGILFAGQGCCTMDQYTIGADRDILLLGLVESNVDQLRVALRFL